MSQQLPIQHNAPAGKIYNSIQHAGQSTLIQFCDNFPNTAKSFMLPSVPQTKYPDIFDHNQNVVPKDRNKFAGYIANVDGEREEYLKITNY